MVNSQIYIFSPLPSLLQSKTDMCMRFLIIFPPVQGDPLLKSNEGKNGGNKSLVLTLQSCRVDALGHMSGQDYY